MEGLIEEERPAISGPRRVCLQKISARVGRHLERVGLLVRDMDTSYLDTGYLDSGPAAGMPGEGRGGQGRGVGVWKSARRWKTSRPTRSPTGSRSGRTKAARPSRC